VSRRALLVSALVPMAWASASAPRPAPGQATSADALRASRDEAAGRGPVEVRASLDRTALWPGDRVRYAIEVHCAPGVDVLAEDLAGERLVLTGLELLSTSRERQARADGRTIHRVEHELTAYAIGAPLRIQEQTLRYYARRPGQRMEDAVPAGEVRVPAISLVMRSTLPDEPGEARLRDGAGAPELPAFLAWLRPAGFALVLLCALPLAVWAAQALGRSRRLPGSFSPRAAPSDDLRPELLGLQAMDTTSPAARRLAYDRLDLLLRRRLGAMVGADARALTPAEIAARLQGRAGGLPESLPAILEECERARYAPLHALPPAARLAAGVAAAQALVEARPWS